MKKLMIINGPNLNFLGTREQDIYGQDSYEKLLEIINKKAIRMNIKIVIYQTNHEGVFIEYIHEAINNHYDGLIVNPAGYSHTSISILDALNIFTNKKIEVHISDVLNREKFRSKLITANGCDGIICNRGILGYEEAIDYIINEN